jgi:PIN domain
MLTSGHITFCVDTNILVEFKALDQIPWREIAPNATNIRIIVPTTVGGEMNNHKTKAGRLRRRGIEFVRLERDIENSADNRAVLRESDPRLTVEFGPIYRRAQLDADLYDLDDKDGRIVAEVANLVKDHPDAVFLADDSKPLRWARQTGIRCSRPPEAWRRADGPDERDREIAQLKRELGAQPLFSIEFPGAANERREHLLEPAPANSCAACSEQLVAAVLAAQPKVPREKSIALYGLAQSFPFEISDLALMSSKLTKSELDLYERDYAKFHDRIRIWAENQPTLLRSLGRVLPIEIRVANDGDRAGERVLVEMELAGAFRFVQHESISDVIDSLLEPPSPPQPYLSRIGPMLEPQEPSQPHVFYLLDEPEADGSTTRLQWRCEEFRHGQDFTLLVIVRATTEGAGGALKVRISSAVVAKTIEATAPLISPVEQVEGNKLCGYLERRIALLPRGYQESVRRALAVSSEACPG